MPDYNAKVLISVVLINILSVSLCITSTSYREPDCFKCFWAGSDNTYCKLSPTVGACCAPGATTDDCDWQKNTSLSCSAETIAGR